MQITFNIKLYQLCEVDLKNSATYYLKKVVYLH